jgi:hypothetical protein
MAVAHPAPRARSRIGERLAHVPRMAWGIIAGLLVAAAVVVFSSAFDWSGRTTVAVAGGCAFAFGVLVAPLAFGRAQRSFTLTQAAQTGAFVQTGETTQGPRVTVRRTPTNGR